MKLKVEIELEELEDINENLRRIELELHTLLIKNIQEDLKDYVVTAIKSVNNILNITDIE